MKSISKILMVITVLLSTTFTYAQIKNSKTETVKIYGNCDMCKATIEKAGNAKKSASVEWNKDTKLATITYDSKNTNPQEVLKRIALAGYDSDNFRAPDDVYSKLQSCCQYERPIKTMAKTMDDKMDMKSGHENHDQTTMPMEMGQSTQKSSQLKALFDGYFLVKDALIKTDGVTTSAKASELLASIKAVEMNKLTADEHNVWMKVMKDLTTNAENISKTKDVAKQRTAFSVLSQNIYALAKVSKQDMPVYYQHCPMYNDGKGANWLSKENVVKNPYYGSQMLTCGKVQETIDNK